MFKYIVLAFMPNTALTFAIKFVFQYERSSQHLSLTNMHVSLFKTIQHGSEYNLLSLLISMIVWSFVYLGASWYVEKIGNFFLLFLILSYVILFYILL